MKETIHIPLDQFDLTDETRLRESDNLELVEEYAETFRQHMKKGKLTEYPFPPGGAYKRADGKFVPTKGRHRTLAAIKVGLKEIPCVIYSDESEAVWAGLGDNRKNGLRNSPGDLKKMIAIAKQLHPKLSNRAIAKHIGCSASSVDQVVRELRKNTQESDQPTEEKKGANEQDQQEPTSPQSSIPSANDGLEVEAKTGQQAADNSGEELSSGSGTASPNGQPVKPAQKSEKKPADEAPNADLPVVEARSDTLPSNSDVVEQISEDRVETLLAQVRKSREDFSKDELAIFADGLHQFLIDIDYLEPEESGDTSEEDDDVFDESDLLKGSGGGESDD